MFDPSAPVWYLSDGSLWWGPYPWTFMQSNPPPPQFTHIWTPGMANWEPLSRVLHVGPVTIQATGSTMTVNVVPPGTLRFGGKHWPPDRP